MVEIGPWLAQKYSILQQEANTHAAAQAALAPYQAAEAERTRALASQVVPTSQAQIGLLGQQARSTAAGALSQEELNKLPPSDILGFLAGARGENQGGRGLLPGGPNPTITRVGPGVDTMGAASGGKPIPYGLGLTQPGVAVQDTTRVPIGWNTSVSGARTPIYADPTNIGGQKKGIAKVPGKGDGTKDTVDAKLAPGEAVLNKPAAEHMGRGLIEALNQLGMQKMGMPPGG